MAITGWREFPAFVGGRPAAKAGKGRERPGIEWGELSGLGRRCLAERSAGAELDAALAAVGPGRPRTRVRPARARSG